VLATRTHRTVPQARKYVVNSKGQRATLQDCPLLATKKKNYWALLLCRYRVRNSCVRSVTRLWLWWLFWVPRLCRDSALRQCPFPFFIQKSPYHLAVRNRCIEKSSLNKLWINNDGILLQCFSGFGGLEAACWPLVPKFAGSHPAEAVGFLGQKISQHAFLRRKSKAVGPML
jgi:hypothetical protein